MNKEKFLEYLKNELDNYKRKFYKKLSSVHVDKENYLETIDIESRVYQCILDEVNEGKFDEENKRDSRFKLEDWQRLFEKFNKKFEGRLPRCFSGRERNV